MSEEQEKQEAKSQERVGKDARDSSQSIKIEYISKSSKKRICIEVFGLCVALLAFIATTCSSYQAARSADIARESSDTAKKTVQLMVMENRPYLFITCDNSKYDCNGRTGIGVTLDSKGKCIEELRFDLNNGGKSPAEIIRANYTFIFHRHDELPFTVNKEHSSPYEQVFVFPDKPLIKRVGDFTVDGKEIDICNVRAIEFTANIDYSMPIIENSVVYSYELSLEADLENKKADIRRERMK